MQIINVVQGTPEWHQLRASYFTASEAPAMMGESKYQTRDALLKAKATGITEEVSASKQFVFDRGHQVEAMARPIVEATIEDDLFPSTCTEVVDGLNLLASLDGLTMDEQIIWECKLLNESLRQAVLADELEPTYYWQLEHQLLVTGAKRVYFTTTDGTEDGTFGCWYVSSPERRAQLIAGWKQFEQDLVNYSPVAPTEKVQATPTKDLPALVVNVQGAVTVSSNLTQLEPLLRHFIKNLPEKPSTDQEFADAEAGVKKLKKLEEAIDQCTSSAMESQAPIADMQRQAALCKEIARTARLAMEKLVTARKDAIKLEIISEAKTKMADHISTLNKRLGQALMPVIAADFAGAVKNKRTVDSLRSSVNEELARAQIEASMTADRIQINVQSLRGDAHDWGFLFPDLIHVCGKAAEDFVALLKVRISEYEAKKVADAEAKARAGADAKQANDRAFESAKETLASVTTALVEGIVPITSNLDAVTQGHGAVLVNATAYPGIGAGTFVSNTSYSGRPTDQQILSALAGAFRVSETTVVGWIKSMDIVNQQPELI